jgi:hypothetical protein
MMTQQDWEMLLRSLTSLGIRVESHNRQTGKIVLAVYPLPRQSIKGTV